MGKGTKVERAIERNGGGEGGLAKNRFRRYVSLFFSWNQSSLCSYEQQDSFKKRVCAKVIIGGPRMDGGGRGPGSGDLIITEPRLFLGWLRDGLTPILLSLLPSSLS